jgi:CubicO group peptidase (beta-lactamase class C family)
LALQTTMRTIFVLALLSLSIIAAASLASGSLQQDQQQIDAIFAPSTQPDTPGLAVLVKSKGQVLFQKGYGLRELHTRARISPDANFRLASFTKQFTAMAIMLLVHDSKLQYEDHLTDIFPTFPRYGRNITVGNLLNHTSGLPDYEDLMEREEKIKGPIWSVEHQIADDEVLRLLEQAPAGKFDPGTSWAYSNSGYVVLGLIVTKVSGMPYRDFLQNRIFAPAGIEHSIVYQKGINEIPNRAFGHSLENGKWTQTDQSSTSATLGDGGIYSNLEDLAKWDEALEKHTLLSALEMAPALSPVKLADGSAPRWPMETAGDNLAPGKPVAYGFGWFLDPYKSHPRSWHTGSSMGFRTVIQRFPDDHLTIVILANRTDVDTKALSDRIADVLLQNNR